MRCAGNPQQTHGQGAPPCLSGALEVHPMQYSHSPPWQDRVPGAGGIRREAASYAESRGPSDDWVRKPGSVDFLAF